LLTSYVQTQLRAWNDGHKKKCLAYCLQGMGYGKLKLDTLSISPVVTRSARRPRTARSVAYTIPKIFGGNGSRTLRPSTAPAQKTLQHVWDTQVEMLAITNWEASNIRPRPPSSSFRPQCPRTPRTTLMHRGSVMNTPSSAMQYLDNSAMAQPGWLSEPVALNIRDCITRFDSGVGRKRLIRPATSGARPRQIDAKQPRPLSSSAKSRTSFPLTNTAQMYSIQAKPVARAPVSQASQAPSSQALTASAITHNNMDSMELKATMGWSQAVSHLKETVNTLLISLDS